MTMSMECAEEMDLRAEMKQTLWQNVENVAFYEALPEGAFERRAEACGLTHAPDLAALWPEVKRRLPEIEERQKEHVLFEVGAGFGRGVDWLLSVVPDARIVAFEQTTRFARQLEERYRERRNVTVFGRSFLGRHTRRKGDLVMLLWSTFVEFNRVEQRRLLRKIKHTLTQRGVAIIDLPTEFHSRGGGTVITELEPEGQEITFKANGEEWRGFLPRSDFLVDQARSQGLTYLTRVEYRTDSGDRRTGFFFGRAEAASGRLP